MKSEKGITLISLIIYVVAATIIVRNYCNDDIFFLYKH